MMSKHRVRITVQKKVRPDVIFNGNVPNQPGKNTPYTECPVDDNAMWIVETDGQMPEGFCPWAWRDLYKDLAVFRFGGDFGFWVEPPFMYTSCSDGVRPVSFKLEKLDS